MASSESAAEPPPLASFRIFNGTPEGLESLQVSFRQVDQGQRFRSTGNQFVNVPPGEWITVTIPPTAFGIPTDLSTLTAKFRKYGIRWDGHPEAGQSIQPQDGGEYRVGVDDECPPLTSEELARAARLVQDLIEGALNATPPLYGTPERPPPEIWRYIVTQMGRDGTNDRIAANTRDMIGDSGFRSMSTYWGGIYDSHPRKQTVSPSAPNPSDVIASGEYKIEVYHRAMDRCPGGNEDIQVIKHTFRPAVDPAQDPSLTAFIFQNWDVMAYMHTQPKPRDPAKAAAFSSSVPAALVRIFEGSQENRDIVCTINDPRPHCEVRETEWSSIEILLKDPEGNLIARVHRRARLTEDQNVPISLMPPEAPASESVQALLDRVEAALRMGTVCEWSEEGHMAADLRGAVTEEWDYVAGIYGFTPIYFEERQAQPNPTQAPPQPSSPSPASGPASGSSTVPAGPTGT
uniref:Uncharacterized protein n=1 Tax=Chromera velia CCMP2878 TaxID=1169474 RepID=A0A0G4GCP0_9ALVE|eukprot:Cvel_21327.t1-p1 / transcript=Cvel_21327.t1 / gene=Cvel_21327 / organism=Chromera_velia_CCMP2878 / gene_product=hypothetical protein / transcript_product=hypothetical protein / location=Cvel_scaffold1989:2395-3774(-) / protein_length=460 / sequence_SO=supercontig / SO=protein_coding / is_pseudo=false